MEWFLLFVKYFRLIIDKLTVDEWGSGGVEPCRETSVASSSAANKVTAARDPHLGKSPGELSAGETLLMLEDACKNERKHSKYLLEMTRVLAMLPQSPYTVP